MNILSFLNFIVISIESRKQKEMMLQSNNKLSMYFRCANDKNDQRNISFLFYLCNFNVFMRIGHV